MNANGFDIDVVMKQLETTFPVNSRLPVQIKLMLANLRRSEDEELLSHMNHGGTVRKQVPPTK